MTARSGVAHQPGLDGLRGLAVAAVLVFHTGLDWLPGGFLGVSLFFTLSGVVIGMVIIHELRATKAFSLGRFWLRRARRLLPAAWLVLALVALGRAVTPRLSDTTSADIIASWLHVANWQFLVKDQSYDDLFGGPSAVLHYWSLAIEEQFYLVVGLLAIGIARVSKRPGRTLGIVAAVGALASFAAPIALSPSIDRVYYGTDTRAGELLIGLVLAAVLARSRRRSWLLERRRAIAAIGLVALIATGIAWLTASPGGEAVRAGLLPAISLASTALIVAAVVPNGLVFRIASMAPLRALGAISYAVYLIHWPLFVLIGSYAPSPWWRLLVGIPLAIGLAVASARLVELPIRRRGVDNRRFVAGGVAVGALLVVGLVLPTRRTSTDRFLDELADDARTAAATVDAMAPPTLASPATGPAPGPGPTPPEATAGTVEPSTPARPTTTTVAEPAPDDPGATTGQETNPPTGRGDDTPVLDTTPVVVPAPRPTTRVAIFGDSIALSLALTAPYLPPTEDRYVLVPGAADIGCGALLSPIPADDGRCATARQRWLEMMATYQADLAVVMSCQWELLDQPIGDQPVGRIGEPAFDAALASDLRRMVDDLKGGGARRVALVRCPEMSPTVGVEGLDTALRDSRDPARVARWNELMAQLDAERRDVVTLDLAAWVDERRDDPGVRPDGEHFRYDVDTGVAAELDRLLRLVA